MGCQKSSVSVLGLDLDLSGALGSGSSPEHTRWCCKPTLYWQDYEGDTRATVTKPEVLFCFSPETVIMQWFLGCKSIGGDNLPALLVSTPASSHPPYLHSHTSTAVKRPCHHFCRGISYTGCPADKIHAFLAYCHWCSVQGSPDNSFEKVQEYELGVRDEHCRMNYLRWFASYPQFPAFSTDRPNRKYLLESQELLLCNVCRLSSHYTSQHHSSVVKGDNNSCGNHLQCFSQAWAHHQKWHHRLLKSAQ